MINKYPVADYANMTLAFVAGLAGRVQLYPMLGVEL